MKRGVKASKKITKKRARESESLCDTSYVVSSLSTTEIHADREFEFQEADLYFKKNKAAVKKSKESPILHSFIQFKGNDIVSLANKDIEGVLGEGKFGVVVKGQKRDRTEIAVKIEGTDEKRSARNPQVRLMKRMNFFLGETHRTLEKAKKFKGHLIKTKRYTALRLLKGEELAKQLKDLSPEQRLIVGIKCSEQLSIMQKNRGIHLDVKPQNFVAQINGLDISVEFCDYDFSMMLPEGVESIELDHWAGTERYRAPEIDKKHALSTFSFAADIHSLGVMFRDDLKLPKDVYQKMIYKDRTKRCSIDEVLATLNDKLAMNETTRRRTPSKPKNTDSLPLKRKKRLK